jgi:hypothetical protein
MNIDSTGSSGGRLRRPRHPLLPHALASQHAPDLTQFGQNGSPTTPQAAPLAVDLSQDPILQQIRAIGAQHTTGAQGDELAGRKQALIAYGYDPSLDSLYPDENTREAAKQNPFSVLATQKHDYAQRTTALEENLNKGNLFYSGYRGTQLGENARNYQQQQATSSGALNDTLSALQHALLSARQEEADRNASALAEAYGRYVPPDTGGTPTPTPVAAQQHFPTFDLNQFLRPPRPPQRPRPNLPE